MRLRFDDGVAKGLIAAIDSFIAEVQAARVSRKTAFDTAREEFRGGYADLFSRGHEECVSEVVRMVFAIEGLREGVLTAIHVAAEERQRLAEVQRWEEACEAARADGYVGQQELVHFIGGRPNLVPFVAPMVGASFSAGLRQRVVAVPSGSSSSAVPWALRSFAAKVRSNVGLLEPRLYALRDAWMNFVDHCSWVDVESGGFLGAIQVHINEQAADGRWLDSSAQAFDQAGGTTLDDVALTMSLGTHHSEAVKALLTDEGLGLEELNGILAALMESPLTQGPLIAAVKEQLEALHGDSAFEEVDRAAILLRAVSGSESLSFRLMNAVGGENFVHLVSLGTALTAMHEPALELISAAREVFSHAQREAVRLEPRLGEMLAVEIVNSLRPSSQLKPFAGNNVFSVEYLLEAGELTTPFLLGMGRELEGMEITGGMNASLWEMKARDARHVGPLLSFTSRRHGGAVIADPLAAYMRALSRNPEAAQLFFTAGDGPGEAEARQTYWIQNRRWGHDDFNGLLGALESATVRGQPYDSDTSALAARALRLLGNRGREWEGEDNPVPHLGGKELIRPGNLGDSAAQSLARIVGNYMPAVDHFVGAPLSGKIMDADYIDIQRSDLAGAAMAPVFNTDDLRVVLQAGLANEGGMIAFREELSAYQERHFAHVMALPAPSEVLGSALESDGRLEAFFVNQVEEVGATLGGRMMNRSASGWV